MKQKLHLLVLLLLVFIAGCASNQLMSNRSNAQQSAERFKLFVANHSYYLNGFTGKDMDKKTLFKIDTQTGQVWRYEEMVKPDTGDKWVLVPTFN